MAPKTSDIALGKIYNPNARRVYIETYGCQMNVADSELVASILSNEGYGMTDSADTADVILLNTCSIRENAEKKIFHRLDHLRRFKKKNFKLVVGIIGCMAERLKDKLIGERDLVSIVVGPDEYRNLPSLVDNAFDGEQGIAVKLSKVETYDDIIPLRTEGISAWISIMRGCNNFCAFCVVPYTRGRERSRPFNSVVEEAVGLWDSGIKEITLLGQNVNSFRDEKNNVDFPGLLIEIAKAVPQLRIRYTTSHPHDMSDRLIEAHAQYANICNYIHLPVQSGSNKVLKKMRRDYSVEHYLERIETTRKNVPGVAWSTDIIAGFCTETEEDHQETLALMREVRYDGAYMFKYSPRENTLAWKYEDDVADEVKTRRLNEIIEQQNRISGEINKTEIGKIHEVLVEGTSKKSDADWQGRTDTNKVCIFPYNDNLKVGEIVKVKIKDSTSATLFADLV
jgi:tRNA-2-methylthio-N6-dimethylallyladenosine synthase